MKYLKSTHKNDVKHLKEIQAIKLEYLSKECTRLRDELTDAIQKKGEYKGKLDMLCEMNQRLVSNILFHCTNY